MPAHLGRGRRGRLQLSIFTRELFSTPNDTANRAAIAAVPVFRPDDGRVKVLLFSLRLQPVRAEWPEGDEVAIRLGSLDADPGIRPQLRTFVASRAPWDEIPDDGR